MTATRREFLQAGGALAICFSIPACSRDEADAPTGATFAGNRLTLFGNGQIELLLGKVEFGQGIGTAMAQIAAEELDIDISRIRLTAVDTEVSPNEFYTFSSISVQQSGPPTRRAAAAARQHLLSKAAAQLGRSVDDLNVVDGVISDTSGVTHLDYWQLIGADNVELEVGDDQAVKPVDEYTIVGESHPRIDIPGKVFGDASFLQDMRLDGMLHARVVRPAFERGTLGSFDATAAEAMPGVVRVIRDGDFVAVVAEREEQARQAAWALRDSLSWENPEDIPHHDDVFEWLRNANSRVEPVASKEATNPGGGVTVERTYQRPYQAHA